MMKVQLLVSFIKYVILIVKLKNYYIKEVIKMLRSDIDWEKGSDQGYFLFAYGLPVWRKVRRVHKFVWKEQYIYVWNPILKS